jgi:hypothetical protein
MLLQHTVFPCLLPERQAHSAAACRNATWLYDRIVARADTILIVIFSPFSDINEYSRTALMDINWQI